MSMGYSIVCQNTHFISHNILCSELERYFIIIDEYSLDINQVQSVEYYYSIKKELICRAKILFYAASAKCDVARLTSFDHFFNARD